MIHIHNGDVVADAARKSSIPGEHLPFRESLVTGPVPANVDLETRAVFLSQSYGEPLLRVRNDLIELHRAVDAAAEHDEVVLWFEHDLFCLANLLFLLNRFSRHRRLSIVWHPKPLLEADLPLLHSSRAAVTPSMLSIAKDAWTAYTSDDPSSLNRFISRDWNDFPFLRDGLSLHAARFPSVRYGLGIVESRIVSIAAGGPIDFLALFARFDPDAPRLGFGDAEVLRTIRNMASRAVPLITVTEDDSKPPKVLVNLTPAAENVLQGTVDYLSVNDPDYWLGGVHLTKETVWRWDEDRRQVVNPAAAS